MSAFTSVETAYNQPESSSQRESSRIPEQGRPKWKFVSYHLQAGADGRYVIEDETSVLDISSGEYRSNVVPTSIRLTDTLTGKLSSGEVMPDDVIAQCNAVRSKLDEKGVKVFYDGKGGKLYPKWKFSNGTKKEEPVLDVPAEILELVRTNPEYFNVPAYKNWFGPRMQHKREQVISDVLAESYPDAKTSESKATINKGETVIDMNPSEKSSVRLAYEAAAEGLVATLASKYELPAEAPKFIEDTVDFAAMFFTHAQRGSKPLHASATKNFVREAMLKRFAGNEAVLAAVEANLPLQPEPPAEAAVAESAETSSLVSEPIAASEDKANDKDDDREPVVPVQEEHQPIDRKEFAFEQEFVAERDALRELAMTQGSVEDLDDLVRKLEARRNSGSKAVQKAVTAVLSDIERGCAGPLSEERLSGLRRTAEEQDLLSAHPALDARNVRVEAGRGVVALIDKHDTVGSMGRLVSRLADDALESGALDEQKSKMMVEYLTNIILGKVTHAKAEEFRRNISSTMAAFNETDSRLEFKDLTKFTAMIAVLAGELRTKA